MHILVNKGFTHVPSFSILKSILKAKSPDHYHAILSLLIWRDRDFTVDLFHAHRGTEKEHPILKQAEPELESYSTQKHKSDSIIEVSNVLSDNWHLRRTSCTLTWRTFFPALLMECFGGWRRIHLKCNVSNILIALINWLDIILTSYCSEILFLALLQIAWKQCSWRVAKISYN